MKLVKVQHIWLTLEFPQEILTCYNDSKNFKKNSIYVPSSGCLVISIVLVDQ